jgi:hypothetical protein
MWDYHTLCCHPVHPVLSESALGVGGREGILFSLSSFAGGVAAAAASPPAVVLVLLLEVVFPLLLSLLQGERHNVTRSIVSVMASVRQYWT